MKRTVLLLSLLFMLTRSYAQTLMKSFFDKEDFQTDSARSYYFEMRVLDDNSNPPMISYYTATSKIRFKEGFKDEQGDKLRTYYYPNGVIKAEAVFSNLGPKGLVNAFYEDGRRQSELFYETRKEGDSNEPIIGIINYWDSLGNLIIDNGKGYCRCNLTPFADLVLIENGPVEDGLKTGEWNGQGASEGSIFSFKETYDKGILIEGIQNWGGNTYPYHHMRSAAEPVGGIKAFYANIADNLRYPASARKRNIQGIVYVEFVVNEGGTLQDIRVAKGFDKVCDDEAIRAVAISPKWSPKIVRGRPVKKRMILPIIFKLRV